MCLSQITLTQEYFLGFSTMNWKMNQVNAVDLPVALGQTDHKRLKQSFATVTALSNMSDEQ